MGKTMEEHERDRQAAYAAANVPEVTPEKTPEVSDLSGGEQSNGKVPA